MASKQVTLTLAVLLIGACARFEQGSQPLTSPYQKRRVWAVAPPANESGSAHADPLAVADHLAHQLENASNVDVLAVNRTLAAMEARGMASIGEPNEAEALLRTLAADVLVIGTITAYDPYEPPKLGLALELYVGRDFLQRGSPLDLRALIRTASGAHSVTESRTEPQPWVVVSEFFDAKTPQVLAAMRRYAKGRGVSADGGTKGVFKPTAFERDGARMYRISMDLFTEFVSYEMSRRLLAAEHRRLGKASVASAVP